MFSPGSDLGRIAVLDTSFKQPPRTLDLPGVFYFDGLSNDAGSLFLTESLTDDPQGKYQVRRYDMRLGALDPNIVIAKGESQIMNGVRQTAPASRDGAWLYSLYLNPNQGPFIHALSLSTPVAFCLDLPKSAMADLARQARWSLALSGDGRTLYAVNGAIGELLEINVAGDIPEIARTHTLFAAPAHASAAAAASTPRDPAAAAPDVPAGTIRGRPASTSSAPSSWSCAAATWPTGRSTAWRSAPMARDCMPPAPPQARSCDSIRAPAQSSARCRPPANRPAWFASRTNARVEF